MKEVVKNENIIVEWFLWHFWDMPKFLFSIWNNYIMFASNFFSLQQLFGTFFAPWKRNAWSYPKNFDLQEYANVFISNIFSSIIGVIMRTALIVAGAFFQVFVLIAGLIVFVLWVVMPFIIVFGIFLIFAI